MKEIEVKILNINIQEITKKLKKIGAKQILKPTLFREYYFEIPNITIDERDFYCFRLRSEGNNNILTVKHNQKDKKYHINKEVEVQVSSIEDTKKLLSILKFKIFRQREKIRGIYKIDNVKIMIDKYHGVNPYIEIEGINKKDVISFVEKLGYSIKDTTNQTATALIKKAGLNPDELFLKKSDFMYFDLPVKKLIKN